VQPGYFSGVEGEHHYPPPPPGGPPHISSPPPPPPPQQAGPYGYETPTHSQHDFAAAELPGSGADQGSSNVPYSAPSQNVPPPSTQQSYLPYTTQSQKIPPPPAQQFRGFDENPNYYDEGGEGGRGFGGKTARYRDEGRRLGTDLTGITNLISGKVETELRNAQGKILGGTDQYGRPLAQPPSAMQCQIVRSCTKWSAGIPTEHSIQDAYISAIENSQHFVYIENQFFITATGDKQEPVYNQIGKALVDRILRAARAGEKYKVIVIIPSVPGFAGDLRDDSALGTRAIMEFQYHSINRGGHSIMELIRQAGFNPLDYIRFYNLRNYDRLNVNNAMLQAERQSGVNYEDARRQNDDALGAGTYGSGTAVSAYNPGQQHQQYQQAAQQVAATKPYNVGSGRWDSVSECYMLGGEDLRNVPWDYPGELSEIDAFVSEELYIHSKVRYNPFIPSHD
jgi:phospholipase D1/2